MTTCCRENSPDRTPAADRQCCGAHAATQSPTGQDACCMTPDGSERLSEASDRAT